jgi:hypothetical protein
MRLVLASLLMVLFIIAPQAEAELGYRVYSKAGTFEEVKSDLGDAIVNRGFVVDYVGHINAMLERTAAAAQSVTPDGLKSPYRHAEFVQFCPAKLVHEAVSANPFALANCPIALFVYELNYEPGKIHVGYRLPVGSPSSRANEVNEKIVSLLHEIATEATK